MTTFEHEVADEVRKASRWDDDYACFVAPDGRAWVYTDDPERGGVSWRDASGTAIRVAVWCKGE